MGDIDLIDAFEGEYAWLSNFWESPVVRDGIFYSTNEHAFQAAKANNLADRLWVANASAPGLAKARGRQVRLRGDWERVKIDIMIELVRDKFMRTPALGNQLVATGSARLVEGNTWGDRFWGVCDGRGENILGQILMKVRGELAPRMS